MSVQTLQKPTTTPASSKAPGWVPVCRMTYNRDTWVKLQHPLNEYAHDEAQLLCQETAETWVAWIPDYGETILHRSEFYSY